VGVGSGGETWGTGYEQARSAIEGEAPPASFFLFKLISTLVATVSGIPGGLFAPSLSVGAGLGSSVALALGSDIGLAAILGMAAYFAGVTQAPMTAIVIIIEMTGGHDIIVPVMAAAMLGYGTARVITPEPLYAALSRPFIADALRQVRAREAALRAAEKAAEAAMETTSAAPEPGAPQPPARG
jgi:H+/Cl- antiporter ClcA